MTNPRGASLIQKLPFTLALPRADTLLQRRGPDAPGARARAREGGRRDGTGAWQSDLCWPVGFTFPGANTAAPWHGVATGPLLRRPQPAPARRHLLLPNCRGPSSSCRNDEIKPPVDRPAARMQSRPFGVWTHARGVFLSSCGRMPSYNRANYSLVHRHVVDA